MLTRSLIKSSRRCSAALADVKKKLKAGYVLDGAQDGLSSLFVVAEHGPASVTPDGEWIWNIETVENQPFLSLYSRNGERVVTHALRELGLEQDRPADVIALSKDAALFATGSGDIWKLEGTTLQVWAEANGCHGYFRRGGDRVAVLGSECAMLFALDGTELKYVDLADHCALSPNGQFFVTHGRDGVVVWNANDGTEVRRFAMNAKSLAINDTHVVIGDSYFEDEARHETFAFSISTGERALLELFPEGFANSAGVLLDGDIFIRDGRVNRVLKYPEFSRTREMHVASGGQYVLLRDDDDVIAVIQTS